MSAPAQKPTEATRIDRNRKLKAGRYLNRFLDQMRNTGIERPELNKAALQTALGLVRSATPEQWRKLAADLTRENSENGLPKKENPPSPETLAVIVAQFEALLANVEQAQAAARAYEAEQSKDDAEVFGTITRWVRREHTAEEHEAREAASGRKR